MPPPPSDGAPGDAGDRAARGPSLAELQRLLFALITAPEGVEKGLAALGVASGELEAVIAGDARATAVARLDVYANMYFFRILDVLRTYFPKLAAVLGDGGFHDLATDYLLAHPPAHPSLRHVGRALPGYVASHAAARDRPWLAALAALEWARTDVFDREDAAPLAREALAALPPDDFASLPLALVPAHELVPARQAVEALWRTVEDGGEPHAHSEAVVEVPAAAGTALLVWRRGVTVLHRRVPPDEAEALAFVRAGGATFGALCDTLGRGRDDQSAAHLAATLLGQWLADELLRA